MASGASAMQGGRWRRAWEAIDERLGLSGLAYPVPTHANGIGYILGGITFFGFLILAGTGVLLAQSYNPTPAGARESIAYIMNTAAFGDIVRGIHFWVANLVMATVLLHMGRVFVTGAYKRPREANWLIGVGLLGVTFGLIFTGTILKWDQEGYEALQHNIEIGGLLGSFGFWFTPEFTTVLPIVGRLYMAHVVILPALGTLLLIAHFLLVKRHGISSLPAAADAAVEGTGPAPEKGGSTFAAHLIRMAGFGLLILAGSVVLALLIGPALGERPNPAIEVTKPWWMFLAFYPLEDWFGLRALLVAPTILVGLLVLLPFVDRSPWRSVRRRRWVIVAGAILAVGLIGLALYGGLTPPVSHVQDAAG
ncbi:MAG: cytochrome b N-terminal domain-containing protein [Chloroflexi bacterium]|nr:cytochrome b N-terminal domain-containing protein [Chloroflexota bacterium]